jgi:hypothetical protein
MKKYNVSFFVNSDITVENVEAETEEEALNKAIERAIEEQPKVDWEYDDQSEPNIQEIAEEKHEEDN